MLFGFLCLLLFYYTSLVLFVYDDLGISGSRRIGYWFMGFRFII